MRDWLEHNKIFFETIAAVLLSVMAIVVGVGEWWTASRQTRLLEVQTAVAEAQALPQFDIALRQQLNETTRTFDDSVLEVTNNGGPVHDFDASSALFLILTTNFNVAGATDVNLSVAVNGYFDASLVTAASRGTLTRMVGAGNNARVAELTREFRESAQARKWAYALLEEQLVLRLQYRDLLNRLHVEYYRVQHVSGGRRLPDDEGKQLYDRWRMSDRPELQSLTGDDLMARVSAEQGRP